MKSLIQRLLVLICILFIATACSSQKAQRTRIQASSSLQPEENPTPAKSAIDWLQEGIKSYYEEKADLAAFALKNSLNKGNLNASGHTLAYWHLYSAEVLREDVDACANALSHFLISSKNVLDEAQEGQLSALAFINEFDLLKKISQARAILSALWTQCSEEFGRSPENPISFKSKLEVEYFLNIAPPCPNSSARTIKHSVYASKDENKNLLKVNIRCNHATKANENENYYLLLP